MTEPLSQEDVHSSILSDEVIGDVRIVFAAALTTESLFPSSHTRNGEMNHVTADMALMYAIFRSNFSSLFRIAFNLC